MLKLPLIRNSMNEIFTASDCAIVLRNELPYAAEEWGVLHCFLTYLTSMVCNINFSQQCLWTSVCDVGVVSMNET